MKRSMLAFGKALGLLAAVYAPTFMIVSALTMSDAEPRTAETDMMATALPLVIVISVVVALILMAITGGYHLRSYGFRSVSGRTLLHSLGLGVGFGFVLRCLVWGMRIEEPAMFTEIAIWQVIVFLWISAPIQEEIIFRGLFQTTLEKDIRTVVSIGRWNLSVAAMGSAVAFSLVHLGLLSVGASWEAAAFVAASALLLGMTAGQFRWRTGSLIPGIVIHAFFNLAGSVWP